MSEIVSMSAWSDLAVLDPHLSAATNGARKVGRIDFILALEENQEFATKFYQACKDGSISKTATFHLFERVGSPLVRPRSSTLTWAAFFLSFFSKLQVIIPQRSV